MLATFAFDVCHEVYRAAREVLDTKIATLNLESSGKYMWRPDRLPRLAEYVADFARAGERALEGDKLHRSGVTARKNRREIPRCGSACARNDSKGPHCWIRNDTFPARPSRMAMFRMFYLGGAEYTAARRHMGISELTWADWAEEIRTRVGRELLRAEVFPPSRYFLEAGAHAAERESRGELRATGT